MHPGALLEVPEKPLFAHAFMWQHRPPHGLSTLLCFPIQGTAQIAAKLSFKGFWAVSLALKVVLPDLRPVQGRGGLRCRLWGRIARNDALSRGDAMFRCRLSTLLLLVVLAALGLAMVAEYRQADRRMSEHRRDRLAAEVFYEPAITLGSCYLLVVIGVWLECRMKTKA